MFGKYCYFLLDDIQTGKQEDGFAPSGRQTNTDKILKQQSEAIKFLYYPVTKSTCLLKDRHLIRETLFC